MTEGWEIKAYKARIIAGGASKRRLQETKKKIMKDIRHCAEEGSNLLFTRINDPEMYPEIEEWLNQF